jgi:hypothetical protein
MIDNDKLLSILQDIVFVLKIPSDEEYFGIKEERDSWWMITNKLNSLMK